MPINLIDFTGIEEGQKGNPIGDLSKGEWEMPKQVEALEQWLNDSGKNLPKGSYIADIGFCPRPGALGGGAVLSPEAMGIMSSIGMSLYLSEYPSDEE